MGGSCSVVGGCGSNGLLYGNGGPAITGGPLGLWGSSASVSGVTTTGITTITRPAIFITDTADTAATNFPLTGTGTGAAGVARWAPAGYDASKNCTGPADSYGRIVNSQAQIIDSAGAVYRSVAAKEFVTGGNLVLDSHIKDFNGSNKLRLRPGVYYFSQINLGNSDGVEIANDWYKADGVTRLWDDSHTAINGAATVDDYNSFGNRITLFVDSGGSKTTSGIGSGLYTALQGDDSASNALRYRRPGNFRIYAKNTGTFTVNGSSSSPVEFNCNLLHYNKDTSGNYYGDISLQSGCHLYGGLFGWTVSMGGGAIVQQYGSGVFSDYDTVTVIPSSGGGGGSGSGGSGSGSGGGVAGGFGGWFWTEVAAS